MGLEQKQNIIRYKILHCLKRLEDRTGFYVDESEYFDMVLSIVRQESEFLLKQSNNKKIHRVKFRNEMLTVIYDKHHSVVVTILKNKWIGKNKDGSYYLKNKKFKKNKKPKPQRVHWRVKYKHKIK